MLSAARVSCYRQVRPTGDHLTSRTSCWRPRKKMHHASRGSWKQVFLEQTFLVPWCIIRVDFSVNMPGSGLSVCLRVTDCQMSWRAFGWLKTSVSRGAVELLDDCLLLSRSPIKVVLKSLLAGYVQRLCASQVGPQCRHCEA